MQQTKEKSKGPHFSAEALYLFGFSKLNLRYREGMNYSV